MLYVEVARRAGVRASPVGFPGHFMASIDGSDGARLLIDPFNGGGVRNAADLRRYCRVGVAG